VIKEANGNFKIKAADKINEKLYRILKNAFLDTMFQNESILNQMITYGDIFIYHGRFNYGGFYGIIHRLFSLVFIMRVIRGYQPMVWQMLRLDRYFINRVKSRLISHYGEIEKGMNQAFNNITITQVENTALLVLNNIIREDTGGEGFNKAAKLCDQLGLGFIKDFLWIATQATEATEWESMEDLLFLS
jgi:hypothetical protein